MYSKEESPVSSIRLVVFEPSPTNRCTLNYFDIKLTLNKERDNG